MKYAIPSRFSSSPCWEGEIEDSGSESVNLGRAVIAAHKVGASLVGARLDGVNLDGVNLAGVDLDRASLAGASLIGTNLAGASLIGTNLAGVRLIGANLAGANLNGATLIGARLVRARLDGVRLSIGKIKDAKVFTGLYRYVCMPILTEDGVPLVRMGCLWKTVEEWDRIGIRTSNPSEYPDDGSEKSEERVRAFMFCRAEALRMAEKLREVAG